MAEPGVRFKQDDGSDFPAWQEITLGNIASRITRKNSNNETDRPLTIASIEGLVDQRTYFGKTIASKDMSGYFLLKNGEFAYNKSYSAGYDYGSIKRLDKYDMGALSTLYICFALNKTENSEFYNCYFNGLSWYSQMQAICAEGARNHGLLNVSPNDFFKICLHVPSSKEEQQKIADFLSSVDEVIAASEQEVANLETQKKAVMKKIFSQEVRFKREDGSDFPEWKEDSLNNLCDYVDYRGKTPEKVTSGIFLITAKNIRMGYIDYEVSQEFISSVDYNDVMHRGKPSIGDVLFTTEAPCGMVAQVDRDDIALAQRVIKYRTVNKKVLLNDYLKYALMSHVFQNELEKKVTGGTVKGIKGAVLHEMLVILPCVEEQRLIADFLSSFDEAIIAAKKEMELWKELKKGLLQQMFV